MTKKKPVQQDDKDYFTVVEIEGWGAACAIMYHQSGSYPGFVPDDRTNKYTGPDSYRFGAVSRLAEFVIKSSVHVTDGKFKCYTYLKTVDGGRVMVVQDSFKASLVKSVLEKCVIGKPTTEIVGYFDNNDDEAAPTNSWKIHALLHSWTPP